MCRQEVGRWFAEGEEGKSPIGRVHPVEAQGRDPQVLGPCAMRMGCGPVGAGGGNRPTLKALEAMVSGMLGRLLLPAILPLPSHSLDPQKQGSL